jgi:hypothetical protein
MTTKTTATRAGWFEKTIPAKLSRSSYMVWFLLLLAAAILTGAYIQKHSVLQAIHTQSLPSIESGLNLTADFHGMQGEVNAAIKAGMWDAQLLSPVAAEQAPPPKFLADSNRLRDQTIADLETAKHINAASGILTVALPGLPPVVDSTELLKIGFQSYEADVNSAWSALEDNDLTWAQGKADVAEKTLESVIYPTAQKLYDSGAQSLTVSLAQYDQFNKGLTIAWFLTAGLLLSVICWQYMFMLANCKILLQATIVTVLLSTAPFTYAYIGFHRVDNHLTRAYALDYPNLLSASQSKQALSQSATLAESASLARTARVQFESELLKSEKGIRYLPFVFVVFIFAGLFYKLAVSRALRDYR